MTEKKHIDKELPGGPDRLARVMDPGGRALGGQAMTKTFKEMAERAAWLHKTAEQFGVYGPDAEHEAPVGTLAEVEEQMITDIGRHLHPQDGE